MVNVEFHCSETARAEGLEFRATARGPHRDALSFSYIVPWPAMAGPGADEEFIANTRRHVIRNLTYQLTEMIWPTL